MSSICEESKPSAEILSAFSDADCGEPFKGQHLVIDFTPIPGVDDDEDLENKCVELLKLLDDHFKLEEVVESASTIPENVSKEDNANDPATRYDLTSTTALDWLEKQGQPEAFATKYKQEFCRIEEYVENHCKTSLYTRMNSSKKRDLTPVSENTVSDAIKPSPVAVNLCAEMDKWDLMHPKSMEQPGRVPTLEPLILENLPGAK